MIQTRAPMQAQIVQWLVTCGDRVAAGDILVTPSSGLRPDLQAVADRHRPTPDAARTEAVIKRHALGLRTAEALFQQLLAQHIAQGSGLSMAEHLEIDAVIDPAQTRAWLISGLQSA